MFELLLDFAGNEGVQNFSIEKIFVIILTVFFKKNNFMILSVFC